MKTINILAYNLHSLINVPVAIYEKTTLLMYYNRLNVPYQLVEIIKQNKLKVCQERVISLKEEIIKLTDSSYFTYIGVHLNKYELIIGPFLDCELNSNQLNSLKMRLKIVGEDNEIFDNFYNNLVVLLPRNIEFIINTFIYSYNKETSALIYKNIQCEDFKFKQINLVETMFESLNYVKQNYEDERKYLDIVKSGDLQRANKYITKPAITYLPKRALNDTLRNEKTRLTILNTLCNRAAIEGGINYQQGHQISTNYGIRIEHLKSIYSTDKLTNEIIIGYTQAVNDYTLKGYSKLMKKAIISIRSNITKRYSLKDLSNDLFISKEHLSRTFKKETNMTVSKYIHHFKMNEAKKLLKLDEQSITNISTMLGYNSSSQFSNTFKKDVGISPKEYKKRNINFNNPNILFK